MDIKIAMAESDMKKPTKLEIRLYDALENLLQDAEANKYTYWGKRKSYNTLHEFDARYGCSRHNGYWNKDPMGNFINTIERLAKE